MNKLFVSCALLSTAVLTVICNDSVQSTKAASSTSGKVGYVSSMEVIGNSKLGTKVKNELDVKFKSSSKEIQLEEQRITKAMQDYKTKESTLSDSAKEAEQSKLMKMRREFDAMVQEKDEEMKRYQQKLNEQLTKEALEAASELAQAENLEAVIDTDTGKVLYVASHANYTSKFTEKINKRHEAKEAKEAKAKVPAKSTSK